MPDIAANRAAWSDPGVWPDGGEGWSEHWGSSSIQWTTVIQPRIGSALPAGSVVEIAPGHGRWTPFLLDRCDSYVGFDLTESCIERCRARFADAIAGRPVRFEANDGMSLPGIDDASVDFVFSFDSLVHVEQATMEAYLEAIVRALRPGARAFLHHSNCAAVATEPDDACHWRDKTQSAESVRRAAESVGLHVLVQEPVSWAHHAMIDCFTSIAKPGETPLPPTVIAENPTFWADAGRLAGQLAPYWRSHAGGTEPRHRAPRAC